MDLRPFVTALLQRREPDMDRLVCSEALDCMEAYYKVTLLPHIQRNALSDSFTCVGCLESEDANSVPGSLTTMKRLQISEPFVRTSSCLVNCPL